ncbi:MAG: Alpha-D-kanosaminyltransferase [Calditrichaeota bacterium]|nr:Alpha-D-kanosaminyltransferase [Calditrichota bacterium]
MVCSSVAWAGTEKWALRTSEELEALGWRVSFVARSPDLFRGRQIGQLTYHRLPMVNDIDAISALRLSSFLKHNADVVILTRVRDYWLGGLAARLAGVPALLRLGVVRKMRARYWRDRLRYGVFPTALLVNARAIRDDLADTPWIDLDSVHVIYNGAEAPGPLPADERARLRSQLGTADGELLLAGAGRLAVEKRWDWMIDAVGRLRRRGLPVRAVVFGDGNERKRLLARVRDARLEDYASFPGHVLNAPHFLAAADIAVLPSRNEGVANAMLEALGLALPVVATTSGGVSELLENGRDLILLEQDDYAGFVNAIERLARDEHLRERLGRHGCETVRRRFRWEVMVRQLDGLLRSLVEGSREPRGQ